jgi:hypothetical protein
MQGISQTIDEWRPTAVAWAQQQTHYCAPKRGRSKSFSEGFNEPPSMPKISAIFRKHKLPEPIVSELPKTTYEGRLHTWLEPPRD